ncbi:uncharacterized protein [Dipodomys merriami]|uniref:uncharacterized protein n=1 Tax=Dipodomys merriami TaxID=94247 RepID=UPI003855D0F4
MRVLEQGEEEGVRGPRCGMGRRTRAPGGVRMRALPALKSLFLFSRELWPCPAGGWAVHNRRSQQAGAGTGREGQLAPSPQLAITGWSLPRRAPPGTGQRASSFTCPTPLARVVTRLPSLSLSRACRQGLESQAAVVLGDIQIGPSLDQALRERDEAIAKKQAVEAELDTCKARLREVEAQLLEVLAEKLRLRQEVEAWEEDMRQLVRQRVQSQLHGEFGRALGDPRAASMARSPGALFPSGWRRHWW